jgi:hypothetical protein
MEVVEAVEWKLQGGWTRSRYHEEIGRSRVHE